MHLFVRERLGPYKILGLICRRHGR